MLFALFFLLVCAARAERVPYLHQAFFFDWNSPGQPYPLAVTRQCESISIKWERGAAQGPNPVPPYYLQVYSSAHTVPIVIPAGDGLNYDWAVPFAPGTLYQICMFDKNGNTGGCQAAYTVIPALGTSSPICPNVTLPPQLDVDGIVDNGPISRYGWIEQCTDVQLVPKGGTPPYTLTVAPSLHPPYNVTGSGALNWTVSLSWSTPFFISLADSAGNMWANGLLHSGGPGKTSACLSDSTTGSQVKPAVAIGSSIGGLAVGLAAGLLSMFFLMQRKLKKIYNEREGLLDLSGGNTSSRSLSSFGLRSQYRPVASSPVPYVDNSTGGTGSIRATQYHVEPFIIPTEDGRRNPASPRTTILPHQDSSSVITAPSLSTRPSHNTTGGAVYVLHHDRNVPPVTIYHEQGQEIVELPPRYPPPVTPSLSHSQFPSDSQSSSNGSTPAQAINEFPPPLQQPRRPNAARKPTVQGSRR